jgi:Holliday junction resolvase RusA-like endonuclease
MMNIQLDLFGEPMEIKSTSLKSSIKKNNDSSMTLDLFLEYPKIKDNPNGDPVPKQGDRTMLMNRKGAFPVEKGGVKYFKKADLYINHYQTTVITKTKEYLDQQLKTYAQVNNIPMFIEYAEIDKIEYVFSPLKSMSKKDILFIDNGGKIKKTTKPDLTDNLNKLLMDSMDGIILKNDSMIWKMNDVTKVYGMRPGVRIIITGK